MRLDKKYFQEKRSADYFRFGCRVIKSMYSL